MCRVPSHYVSELTQLALEHREEVISIPSVNEPPFFVLLSNLGIELVPVIIQVFPDLEFGPLNLVAWSTPGPTTRIEVPSLDQVVGANNSGTRFDVLPAPVH